jgi:hypothetical protein
MSSLHNLSSLAILKGATRQNIKNIMKVPQLVGALGPTRAEQLQTLRRLLKFLDLYVEHKRALKARINAQKLPNGVSALRANKEVLKARQNRVAAANQNIRRIINKGRVLRQRLGLHVYRNILPFNNSTLRDAVRRISLLRNEGNNRRKLHNNLQALYSRSN